METLFKKKMDLTFETEDIKRVCEIEVKIMINEVKVLNGYLKSSCKV
jgi:hypothetical protein